MKILGVIPSRYASSRFPGKPLVNIKGKPMVQHVYERAIQAKRLSEVVVATDDQRIFDAVKAFNGKAIMTSESCENGTDRCREVIEKHLPEYDVIINIQGDEPYVHPEQIDKLCSLFENENVKLGTLAKQTHSADDILNPSRVKVVIDKSMDALYFSRSPIPFLRGKDNNEWGKHHIYYKHLGLYGYRKEELLKYNQLKPSALEKAEALEQLKWLENGYKMRVGISEHDSYAIDTPEDLDELLSREG